MDIANLSKFNAFLQTPPLWHGNYDGLEQFEFPDIDLKDFHCEPIPENLRLGHQMEHIFHQLITNSSRYRISAFNIPIRRNKISLGEIDFILEDLTMEKRLHVELTYKFYVLDPEFPSLLHQLVGPNRRDTFYAKKEKIKNHQIPLLHSAEGDKVLQDLDIDYRGVEHRVCFKAQVFVPIHHEKSSFFPFNSECVAGIWMDRDTFSSFIDGEDQLYIPPKKDWPKAPTSDLDWQTYDEVLGDINTQLSNKNSPMVWLKKSNGELMKIFVVWWL
ncbi:DUF1853 family protein [Sediminicola sp. 1XM1-17]|uniref:DUF1853 family protein n=1 Tax=Sediminicola sp. 1XM1-17 TaxID=3127702 RepID=UPI0030777E01